jgi:hypothetical protein
VGSGDLATVTGYYRPGRRELLGWVEIHSGENSPGQAVMSRISRRRLSESLVLNEEWWGEWSGNGESCPIRIIYSLPPATLPLH